MSPVASRVLLRLLLIFGVILLGGLLMWSLGNLGPSALLSEREARLLTPEEVRARLRERGLEVLSLARDGSLYNVEVRDSEGSRALHVDGETGTLIGLPQVTGPAMQIDALRRRLQAAGYREIGPIAWERGSYRTEATGPQGQRYRLSLDTYSGEILERVPQ